jgi:hypothetical protein
MCMSMRARVLQQELDSRRCSQTRKNERRLLRTLRLGGRGI